MKGKEQNHSLIFNVASYIWSARKEVENEEDYPWRTIVEA